MGGTVTSLKSAGLEVFDGLVAGQVFTIGFNEAFKPRIVFPQVAEPLETLGVTPLYFTVLGVPVRGRVFTDEDERTGAEAVAIAQTAPGEDVFGALRNADIRVAATVPRAGESLYAAQLPRRVAFLLGAEGSGLRPGLVDRADLHLTIPGSGAVESLNVAASAAVLFGEYYRQQLEPSPRKPSAPC